MIKETRIYIVLKIALCPVDSANWTPLSPESSVRKLFETLGERAWTRKVKKRNKCLDPRNVGGGITETEEEARLRVSGLGTWMCVALF